MIAIGFLQDVDCGTGAEVVCHREGDLERLYATVFPQSSGKDRYVLGSVRKRRDSTICGRLLETKTEEAPYRDRRSLNIKRRGGACISRSIRRALGRCLK